MMGISREEALDCYRSDDLIGLGMEADAVRRKLHPEDVVTYATEGSIDCTDSEERILEAVGRLVESDTTAISLSNATAAHDIVRFETLLTTMRHRFPRMVLQGLSAADVLHLAQRSGLTPGQTILRLHKAGLDTLSSGDCDNFDAWLAIHRAAHELGLRTTAGISFSSVETLEHRLDHLAAIRQLQEATGSFNAFVPSVASAPGLAEPTAVEYLKTLAISRIFLDNIENIQSSLQTADLKVLQVSLRFGCNDAGNTTSEEKLRHAIRDAGFRPAQRDALYRTMLLN